MVDMPVKSRRSHDIGIQDVADVAQVSRAAVSLVLNDRPIRISQEKRRAILEAANKLGYRPHVGARRLIRQKMDTIGLVFPYAPEALSEFRKPLPINPIIGNRHRESWDSSPETDSKKLGPKFRAASSPPDGAEPFPFEMKAIAPH